MRTLLQTNIPYRPEPAPLLQALHCTDPGAPLARQALALQRSLAPRLHPCFALRRVTLRPQPRGVLADGLLLESPLLAALLGSQDKEGLLFLCSGGEEPALPAAESSLLPFVRSEVLHLACRQAYAAMLAAAAEHLPAGPLQSCCPGSLPDWPLQQLPALFALLDDLPQQIGMSLSSGGMMQPLASLCGILFPTEEAVASCRLCPREGCPDRSHAFEAELRHSLHRS